MSRSVIFLLLASVLRSSAGNVPTCKSGFEWTFNSLCQSPCTVASALAEACSGPGPSYDIPALEEGHYVGPTYKDADLCRCSSVFYSMLSACALCQRANFIAWTTYKQNCTTIVVSVFPTDIPAGFAVPAYAYLDVTANRVDDFNPQLAEADTGPESTAPPAPSTSTTSSSVPTTSTDPHNQGSARKSEPNRVVIAGIVVGGLVASTSTIIVLLVVRSRRRSHRLALTEKYMSAHTDGA